MPVLSRWFLRSAFVCLLLGLLLGVWTSFAAASPGAAALVPVALHLVVVGWATQMIFGVAYWMFPRPAPDRSFGNPIAGWVALGGFNVGLLLRALGEPLRAAGGDATVLLAASALLQFLATAVLAATLWRRLSPR